MTNKPIDLINTTSTSKPLQIVDSRVEEYLLRLYSKYDEPILTEMEQYASERNFPIVGRMVGPLLESLARSIGAKRIFELGSGFGYSAYWFSKAIDGDGKIICTDGSEENVRLGRQFLERAGKTKCVEYHMGWAQTLLQETEGDFDIIYNDADKDAYPEIWKLSRHRIRPGGLYIADNALWGGRVALDGKVEDLVEGYTEAIREHNQLIADDPEFSFFLNPVRDGVIVARKKSS